MNTPKIDYDLKLNRELAEALGWTEIFETKGALLGRPPGGSPRSRDQGMIPNWTGSFNECCELGLTYRITPHQATIENFMYHMREEHGIELDFKRAYRHFMIRKVLERLRDQEADRALACAAL